MGIVPPMSMDAAAVILAAGVGSRLRPLTSVRPKALCPVGGALLVDRAIARARRHTQDVAVNVHHHREQMEDHLRGRVHLSIEPRLMGTAGALGAIRDWIDRRPVLLLNADAYHDDDLSALIAGWDGECARLLTVDARRPADFGTLRYTGAALLPWAVVAKLQPHPSGLADMVFYPLHRDGDLQLVRSTRAFYDCGTVASYHAANMHASGGAPVIEPGAQIDGVAVRSVVWSGASVPAGERLVNAVRARDDLTVYVDRVARAETSSS